MNKIKSSANDAWLKTKSTLGLKKFRNYGAYETYILLVYTLVFTAYKEYGIKSAKLTLLFFDLDSESSLRGWEETIKKDSNLVMGDRMSYLKSILKYNVSTALQDNFLDYLSSPQWLAASVFVSKNYIKRDMGDVDDSALFPSNITRERTDSYRTNDTKRSIMLDSIKFIKGIPFIGSNAMKIHLITMCTSLMWYSDDDIWAREHNNMWVNGNKGSIWLKRRATLGGEAGVPRISNGIF